MPFESFDNKIKEAAENHHPAYDEKAWTKMENLLDKHLPVEKDNSRKWLLLLFIFLFAGGAAWLLISSPWQKSKPTAKIESSKPGDNVNAHDKQTLKSSLSDPVQPSVSTPEESTEKIKKQEPVSTVLTDNRNIVLAPKVKNNRTDNFRTPIGKKDPPDNIGKVPQSTDNDRISKKDIPVNVQQPAKDDLSAQQEQKNKPLPDQKINSIPDQKAIINREPVKVEKKPENTSVAAPIETLAAASKAAGGIKSQKKKSGFFLSFSTGPDISASGSDKPGKLRFVLGAGLGYTIHDRFTIRTGFYEARKIYTATPDEYHPPAVFWTFYPDLKKVDADCKVYEIPLLFSYNFRSHSNHNWFAGAGLSSYLMKEENYDYYYKNSSGQLVDRKRTLTNANNHFFSILDLSGGYHRNINNTLSFSIEPYLRLPLDGVGYGKVKLNSAGVLFTLGVSPFDAVKKSKK